MGTRITERLVNGEWSVTSFKYLNVGDVIRVRDIPNTLWRIDEAPRSTITESGIDTMGVLATPVTLPSNSG